MSDEAWAELEQKAPAFAKQLAKERRQKQRALTSREKRRLIIQSTKEALSSVGIPPSSNNISRWEGLSGEEILNAIDRGFPSGEEFRRDGTIKADYSEIGLLTPKEADLARTGISLKLAARLAELESPTRFILVWLGKGFSGTELIKWERAGIRAFIAVDWRSAGFTATESAAWRAEGFTDPNLARKWLDSGVDPKSAARRHAAGIHPRESPPADKCN